MLVTFFSASRPIARLLGLCTLLASMGCQLAAPPSQLVDSSYAPILQPMTLSAKQEQGIEEFYTSYDDYPDEEFRNGQPRLKLSGFWMPAIRIVADKDHHEFEDDLKFPARLHTANGWGVRAGLESKSKDPGVSFGILYLNSRHQEKRADNHMHAHQAYLEALVHGKSRLGKVTHFTHEFGIGVGGALFDFHSDFDDEGGAAIESRIRLGIEIDRRIGIFIGGGGFLWGYPGETIGRGGFFTIGAQLSF